jgi:thiamine-phosphate pyrophosphorylase
MICLVTDRRRLGVDGGFDRVIDLVAAAAETGVDLVQVRERDLAADTLFELVRRCVEAARGSGARIVVNDRIDVALAAGAQGVHLRGDSLNAPAARAIVGPEMLVGCSVHSVSETAAASTTGAVDYAILGTLYRTQSKPDGTPTLSLEEMAEASRLSKIPVLAIGGVTVERTEALARAGAAGVAGIGLFIPPRDVAPLTHLGRIVPALRDALQSGTRLGAVM